MDEDNPDNPPTGFHVIYDNERFENVVGPISFRNDENGRVAGRRVQRKHRNGLKTIQGGMLTAFADAGLTGIDWFYREDPKAEACVTGSLNCEFASSARLGDWLECPGDVVKRGRRMVFIQGRLVEGVTVVMTCFTVLKRIPRSVFEEA
ncbi:MAG: PaaI family thioesterase [Rhodospirillales bacterium]|nr:PaaI family thioesterase [Rhodospirillales bacterium]